MILIAASEAHPPDNGSFLVSPNAGLMVWTLVVFGLALFILSKLAFPKIAAALDKRQKAIEDAIDTADRTKREADELLAEYRERLSEARTQADEIVGRARKTAESTEAEGVAEAKRKRDELMEATQREIAAETQRAVQGIRSEVADLTVLATEKVTRKSLTGDDQRKLVEDALSELDFSSLGGDKAGVSS
jgi:F-type H+-transporting ATPase subunit b